MFNEINNNLEKKKLTKFIFLVFLVISGVVEGNPRIGLFLNKCITLLLTLLEADIGTVITKKVIMRGEKFSESVPRSVRCNVATGLQYIHRKRSSAALSWSCGQCGGGGQFEIYTFWMKF